ncbi:MAG: hypothetical protein JWN98_878, partial [Abditibacteriota bacterium]|nr:hypothetical protein [Abditibacteriota bacterium]
MLNLEGKVAIVTGSGEGIGRHIALAFAQQGASVVVLDIKAEAVRETEHLIGMEVGAERVLALHRDISQSEEIDQTVADCMERFGRL